MYTGNLLFSSFHVYALLDLGSTLSMVPPFVANQFELLPEILHEPFLVSTPIEDSGKVEELCRERDGIATSSFEIKLGVIRFKS